MALRAATMNENSNLYLMLLCQLGRLGQLSQWPVFNQPTQRTQRTQLVIFVLNVHAPFWGTTMNENSNLYLMPLCQLGQLSQWPVFNRPTLLTQRT